MRNLIGRNGDQDLRIAAVLGYTQDAFLAFSEHNLIPVPACAEERILDIAYLLWCAARNCDLH